MPKVKSFNQQNDLICRMFKTALIEKEWTQSHLAKICGFSNSQMSRIINTPNKCCFSTIQQVSKKLGIKELPIV